MPKPRLLLRRFRLLPSLSEGLVAAHRIKIQSSCMGGHVHVTMRQRVYVPRKYACMCAAFVSLIFFLHVCI